MIGQRDVGHEAAALRGIQDKALLVTVQALQTVPRVAKPDTVFGRCSKSGTIIAYTEVKALAFVPGA